MIFRRESFRPFISFELLSLVLLDLDLCLCLMTDFVGGKLEVCGGGVSGVKKLRKEKEKEKK